MGNTTRTQIPAEVNNFYDKTLLMRAVPAFIHARWAQVRDIPRKAGTSTIKFRRYGNLSAATTALTEGVTPTGSSLSVTDITATVAQYGDFVTITDVLDYESEDPILMETAEILGDQMGDTIDQITRDILAEGTSAFFVGSGSTQTSHVDTGDIITDVFIKKAVRLLKNNKAKKITRMINADTGVNTTPINACFIGLVHPNTTYDLKGVTGWVPVEKYASTKAIMDGEVGAVDEVRFVESPNAKVRSAAGQSSNDVYCTLIFGAEAYGTTRISGEAVKNIVKPLGSAGTDDPLDQRATSGWKITFVAKILNNDFITRIEHAVTA